MPQHGYGLLRRMGRGKDKSGLPPAISGVSVARFALSGAAVQVGEIFATSSGTFALSGSGAGTSGGATSSALDADWALRSGGAGVFFTKRWDSSGDVSPFLDANPGNDGVNVVFESSIKRSGNGSLRINFPDSYAANAGATRLSLGQTRGNGSTTYYQVTYYKDEVLARYTGTYPFNSQEVTGQKIIDIAAYSDSNPGNSVVIQDVGFRGFPMIYYYDGISGAVNTGFQVLVTTPQTGGNYKFANALDAGSPTSQSTDRDYEKRYGPLWKLNSVTQWGQPQQDVFAANLPSPSAQAAGLVRTKPGGWITLLIRVTIGTLGTASSTIEVWACQTGRPYTKIHSASGLTIGNYNGGHNGIWLMNYESNRGANSRLTGATGHALWTEVIASANTIPAPMQAYISGGAMPYNVPTAAGGVTAIGPASGSDLLIPSGWTSGEWNYGLFEDYGGGVLVEDYSPLGAYAKVGGGHTCTEILGAVLFDFTTGTWSQVLPSGRSNHKPYYQWQNDCTEGTYKELTGTSIPQPGHSYGHLCQVPSSSSLPKGGLAWIARDAVNNTSNAADSCGACHVQNLETGAWSRMTNGTFATSNGDGFSTWDQYRRRWWHIPAGYNGGTWSGRKLDYLDANDLTIKTLDFSGTTYPGDTIQRGAVTFWRGFILRQGYLGAALYLFDPDQPSLGWKQLTVTGASLPGDDRNCFCWHEGNNKLYWLPNNGGSVLTVLTPPTTDLRNGTWTLGTVNLSESLPAKINLSGNNANHYRNLIYVPSLDRLAWIPGGPRNVYLINPA